MADPLKTAISTSISKHLDSEEFFDDIFSEIEDDGKNNVVEHHVVSPLEHMIRVATAGEYGPVAYRWFIIKVSEKL